MKEKNFGVVHKIAKGLLYPWTSRVRSLNPDLQDVIQAQKQGQVLFVAQGASFIDFLVIDQILAAKGGHRLSFSHGISPFLMMPFTRAFKVWSERLFMKSEARHQKEL